MQSMRGRGPVAPRKDRLWTVQRLQLTLTAALVGTADQPNQNLGNAFESQTGRVLRGATVSTMYLRGIVQESSGVTSPVNLGLSLGAIVANEGLNTTFFPNIALGDGDYFLRDCRTVREVSAEPFIVEPSGGASEGGLYNLHNRSMRKINRVAETVFLLAQKDVATERDIIFDLCVTTLWLIP